MAPPLLRPCRSVKWWDIVICNDQFEPLNWFEDKTWEPGCMRLYGCGLAKMFCGVQFAERHL